MGVHKVIWSFPLLESLNDEPLLVANWDQVFLDCDVVAYVFSRLVCFGLLHQRIDSSNKCSPFLDLLLQVFSEAWKHTLSIETLLFDAVFRLKGVMGDLVGAIQLLEDIIHDVLSIYLELFNNNGSFGEASLCEVFEMLEEHLVGSFHLVVLIIDFVHEVVDVVNGSEPLVETGIPVRSMRG